MCVNSAEQKCLLRVGGYCRVTCASSMQAKNRWQSTKKRGAGCTSAGAGHRGRRILTQLLGRCCKNSLIQCNMCSSFGLLFVFTGDLHLKSHCQICMHKHVRSQSRNRKDALWFPEQSLLPIAYLACTPMEQHRADLPNWPRALSESKMANPPSARVLNP